MRIGTFQRLRIKSGGRNRETEHAPKFVRSLDNLRSLTRPLFPSNCYCPIDLIGITLEVKKLPHTEREKERKKSGSFSSKGFDGIRSTIFASGANHQRFSKLSVVLSFVNWDFFQRSQEDKTFSGTPGVGEHRYQSDFTRHWLNTFLSLWNHEGFFKSLTWSFFPQWFLERQFTSALGVSTCHLFPNFTGSKFYANNHFSWEQSYRKYLVKQKINFRAIR